MDYAEIGEEGTEGAARKLLVGKDHDTGHHFIKLLFYLWLKRNRGIEQDFHKDDPLLAVVLKQAFSYTQCPGTHCIRCMFSCLLSVRVNFANFEILKYIRFLLIIHNKKINYKDKSSCLITCIFE